MGAGVPKSYRHIGKDDTKVDDKYSDLPDDWGCDVNPNICIAKQNFPVGYISLRKDVLSLVNSLGKFDYRDLEMNCKEIKLHHSTLVGSDPALLNVQMRNLKKTIDSYIPIRGIENRKTLTKGRMLLESHLKDFPTLE